MTTTTSSPNRSNRIFTDEYDAVAFLKNRVKLDSLVLVSGTRTNRAGAKTTYGVIEGTTPNGERISIWTAEKLGITTKSDLKTALSKDCSIALSTTTNDWVLFEKAERNSESLADLFD